MVRIAWLGQPFVEMTRFVPLVVKAMLALLPSRPHVAAFAVGAAKAKRIASVAIAVTIRAMVVVGSVCGALSAGAGGATLDTRRNGKARLCFKMAFLMMLSDIANAALNDTVRTETPRHIDCLL
jgi:hypothetical protein